MPGDSPISIFSRIYTRRGQGHQLPSPHEPAPYLQSGTSSRPPACSYSFSKWDHPILQAHQLDCACPKGWKLQVPHHLLQFGNHCSGQQLLTAILLPCAIFADMHLTNTGNPRIYQPHQSFSFYFTCAGYNCRCFLWTRYVLGVCKPILVSSYLHSLNTVPAPFQYSIFHKHSLNSDNFQVV